MEINYPPYNQDEIQYDIEPTKEETPPTKFVLNFFLFAVTVFTTLGAGAFLEGVYPYSSVSSLLTGVPFAATLLTILGVHEFGHYFACKRHKLHATLPFFIPAPTMIGTLGAVIKIKTPIKSKKALFDVGAAGPIAGFIVAIPAIIYGAYTAEVMAAPEGSFSLSFGDPLIFKIASYFIIGKIPEGFAIYISSIGFAGWVGMLVTAFNLLPVGQLDGGHIVFALLGEKQHAIGKVTFFSLVFLTYLWWGWFLWLLIILAMKIKHPPIGIYSEQLDIKRKVLGVFCVIMFILCFIPVPVEGMGLMEFISLLM